jgi:hypothetical protein
MQRELKIGDRIRDNDPRRPNRELEIVELLADGIKAKDKNGRVFGIQRRRIHADGKARTRGFALLGESTQQ